MVISLAMCNVDSWDLMSSCLAYVAHSNKLLCWIMYHMYYLPALWRLINALIMYHLNQDFSPCSVELSNLALPTKIKSSARTLFSAACCSVYQTLKRFWEKPIMMIFWRINCTWLHMPTYPLTLEVLLWMEVFLACFLCACRLGSRVERKYSSEFQPTAMGNSTERDKHPKWSSCRGSNSTQGEPPFRGGNAEPDQLTRDSVEPLCWKFSGTWLNTSWSDLATVLLQVGRDKNLPAAPSSQHCGGALCHSLSTLASNPSRPWLQAWRNKRRVTQSGQSRQDGSTALLLQLQTMPRTWIPFKWPCREQSPPGNNGTGSLSPQGPLPSFLHRLGHPATDISLSGTALSPAEHTSLQLWAI